MASTAGQEYTEQSFNAQEEQMRSSRFLKPVDAGNQDLRLIQEKAWKKTEEGKPKNLKERDNNKKLITSKQVDKLDELIRKYCDTTHLDDSIQNK